jgi:hypothetical protein
MRQEAALFEHLLYPFLHVLHALPNFGVPGRLPRCAGCSNRLIGRARTVGVRAASCGCSGSSARPNN